MKKSIRISIITISLLAILAGASVGLVYAFAPSADAELEVVNVTTQSATDQVTVVLECSGNESGHLNRHQFGRMFAYMHQIQFNNSDTNETMLQIKMQNKWQHRVQAGKTMMFQYEIEGLEHGMQLTLRIEYNFGKVLMYQFTVNA